MDRLDELVPADEVKAYVQIVLVPKRIYFEKDRLEHLSIVNPFGDQVDELVGFAASPADLQYVCSICYIFIKRSCPF